MHKFDTKIATYSILSKLIEMQPEYKKKAEKELIKEFLKS